jgi:hypothetical protein
MTKITDESQVEDVMMKPAGKINKAARSKTGKKIGAWAFMIGFTIAVLAGLLSALGAVGVMTISVNVNSLLLGTMALIGLIVGIVNVSDKEAVNFLIGAIAITAASGALSALANFGSGVAIVQDVTNFVAVFISSMMDMVVIFVAPAAIIVGLKVIYKSARKA